MTSWYVSEKRVLNSPSFRDGISFLEETRMRREAAQFINELGNKLGLRYPPMATGTIYFHRFFLFHSFKAFDRYVVATACLMLAGKVEEMPKKCNEIIRHVQDILGPEGMKRYGAKPKEEVLSMEKTLLETIRFDLQVEHPYTFLLKYAKTFKIAHAKTQTLVQMAWTFINDSMYTTLGLLWEPEIIAIALIILACKLQKFEITDWHGRRDGDGKTWWDQFVADLPLTLLEEICHHALDLYSLNGAAAPSIPSTGPPSTVPPSTPQPSAKRVPPGHIMGQAKRPKPNTPSPAASIISPKDDIKISVPSGSSIPTTSTFTRKAAVGGTKQPTGAPQTRSPSFAHSNSFMSQNMFGSSFLSAEGNHAIQTMVSDSSVHPSYYNLPTAYGGSHSGYGNYPSSSSQTSHLQHLHPPHTTSAHITGPPSHSLLAGSNPSSSIEVVSSLGRRSGKQQPHRNIISLSGTPPPTSGQKP